MEQANPAHRAGTALQSLLAVPGQRIGAEFRAEGISRGCLVQPPLSSQAEKADKALPAAL